MKLKRSSIFIKIVIAALIVYGTVSLVGAGEKISTAKQEQEELQKMVEAAAQSNAELEYDIEHAGDDETIAEIARTKLGLVLPGEKIFYDVNN